MRETTDVGKTGGQAGGVARARSVRPFRPCWNFFETNDQQENFLGMVFSPSPFPHLLGTVLSALQMPGVEYYRA